MRILCDGILIFYYQHIRIDSTEGDVFLIKESNQEIVSEIKLGGNQYGEIHSLREAFQEGKTQD